MQAAVAQETGRQIITTQGGKCTNRHVYSTGKLIQVAEQGGVPFGHRLNNT